jgi:hypothetical protein
MTMPDFLKETKKIRIITGKDFSTETIEFLYKKLSWIDITIFEKIVDMYIREEPMPKNFYGYTVSLAGDMQPFKKKQEDNCLDMKFSDTDKNLLQEVLQLFYKKAPIIKTQDVWMKSFYKKWDNLPQRDLNGFLNEKKEELLALQS